MLPCQAESWLAPNADVVRPVCPCDTFKTKGLRGDGKGPKEGDRPPFFGLWVGNVHASLVQEGTVPLAANTTSCACNPWPAAAC